MVLISHRPSLLALASRVYDLVDGKLELRPETNHVLDAPAQTGGPGGAQQPSAPALNAPLQETQGEATKSAIAGAAS